MVGHHTVVGVLAFAVVLGVVFVRLHKAGFLDRRDQGTVFLWRFVGGSVHFIGEHAEEHCRSGKQVEPAEGPEQGQKHQAKQPDFFVPADKCAAEKAARCVVVLLVLPDRMAKNRPFRVAIAVLKPVEGAGQKISEIKTTGDFQGSGAQGTQHCYRHDILLTEMVESGCFHMFVSAYLHI